MSIIVQTQIFNFYLSNLFSVDYNEKYRACLKNCTGSVGDIRDVETQYTLFCWIVSE